MKKVFKLYKYRSMSNARDADVTFLPDNQRITAIGKFIRSSSLDEIPQFLMWFLGQMSIVGPRPLLISDLPFCKGEQTKRHWVKPVAPDWPKSMVEILLIWKRNLS